jgi:hypothetical protein
MDERGENPPQSQLPADEFYVEDDLPAEDVPAPHKEDDLDAQRIGQITRNRRTAYRSRGYLLIGSAVCIALALQLIWMSIGRFRGRYNVSASAFVMAAAILFALAWRAFGRAGQLKREADASALSEPETPPDFSQLRDGSDSWKNLEEIK